jgi:hypothetical protein
MRASVRIKDPGTGRDHFEIYGEFFPETGDYNPEEIIYQNSVGKWVDLDSPYAVEIICERIGYHELAEMAMQSHYEEMAAERMERAMDYRFERRMA